ncbi:hypothetical protein D3C85_1274310 [compost metagenome]
MPMGVILAHQHRQFLTIPRRLEPFIDRFDQFQPLEFVGNVPWPFIFRRQPFAQVMQQAGPAHGQRLFVLRGLFQHAQGMHARIDFRVMSLRLRHAEQSVDFRHQLLERAACSQHFNKYLRLIFHQCAGNLFPAAFRCQRLQFT